MAKRCVEVLSLEYFLQVSGGSQPVCPMLSSVPRCAHTSDSRIKRPTARKQHQDSPNGGTQYHGSPREVDA